MIIIEGFKRVGKDTYLNKKREQGAIIINYDDFGFKDKEHGCGQESAWIVGATLSKLPLNDEIYLNRGILSTMYYHKGAAEIYEYIYDHYIQDMINNRVKICYMKHKDRSVAHRKFMGRKNESRDDIHDNFYDFEDYWKKYKAYDLAMMRYIKALRGIQVEIIYND